jgi:hypothetical protein
VAIAPVMAKTKSKCASGLKIIQFFLIFENKSKMSFRFEKKQKKTRKTEKIETKRKNIEKTNKKTRKNEKNNEKNWRFL